MKNSQVTILSLVLYPITLLYGLVIRVRNQLFDWEILPSREFDLPVISVGNITVGGTGKTPHVEYLVELLKPEFKIAALSRGYKRKTRSFRIATPESGVEEIGDEPRQMKQKYPDITVAVDRKRVHGIEQLIELPEQVDVVLLDDAFQHRYVKPGISILLIDYNRLIQEDMLLPSGRLREPASARSRAQIILVTRSPERIKPIEMRNLAKRMNLEIHQHLFFTTVGYGDLKPVYSGSEIKDPASLKAKKAPVLILAGIANPRPIRRYARSISTQIHEIIFPDHHRYTTKDLEKICKRYQSIGHPDTIILTTEKDAMRLQSLQPGESLRRALCYVTIHVRFLNNDQTEFNQIILNYVRSNKRDNILYQGKSRSTARNSNYTGDRTR